MTAADDVVVTLRWDPKDARYRVLVESGAGVKASEAATPSAALSCALPAVLALKEGAA